MSEELKIWPNFFAVGAAKCGTTSLWVNLRKHPQIFLPKLREPSYFMSIQPPPEMRNTSCAGDLDAYQRLYQGALGFKAIGDPSLGYLWDVNAARAIHEVCPRARIVILLRDPVERAYSHYHFFAVLGRELPIWEAMHRNSSVNTENKWNFHQYYAEIGLYHEQVLRYIETFGREQVGIYLFEDMQKDAWSVMSAICRHIGVDPALLDEKEVRRVHNAGRIPRVRWLYDGARRAFSNRLRRKLLPESVQEWIRSSRMFYRHAKPPRDERTTKYLKSIYEPDLRRLEDLLGRKLPELRSTW